MLKVKKLALFQNVALRRALILTTVALGICFSVEYLDRSAHLFDYLEQQSYGFRLEVDGNTHQQYMDLAQHQIQVVSISDDTYKWAANGGASHAFMPRRDYALLIDKLTSYGAKVIVFDILFDTPQDNDDMMASSIKKSGIVVLACADKDDNHDIIYPDPTLLNSGCHVGDTQANYSGDSSSIDDIEPVIESNQDIMPALSVQAVRVARGIANLPFQPQGATWSIPNLPIPFDVDDPNPAFKVRFVCGRGDPFPELPCESIIGADEKQDSFYRASTIFRDKIIVIGDTTKINNDFHDTPIGNKAGAIIQANAVATLLNGRFVKQASPLGEFILTMILASSMTVLAAILPLRRALAPILLLLPIYCFANIWIFVGDNLYLHFIGPSISILLTELFVLIQCAWTEESEKSRMRGLLQRYVNPRIADHILKHPEIIGGSGKREYGTILFSDIRGFTKLSEELSPEELVARMNEYFQIITEIVFRHDGTAASIVGDALLAVFGIPVPTIDHADRAVAAAVEIQAAVKALGRKWNPYSRSTLESGIGINTGEIIVGEVGGKHLRNFTVYGLNVNIAARVEATNKDLGTNILITRSTRDALKRPVTVNAPVSVQVKGVLEPVDVFEVVVDYSEIGQR